jgi:hypothetical protein
MRIKYPNGDVVTDVDESACPEPACDYDGVRAASALPRVTLNIPMPPGATPPPCGGKPGGEWLVDRIHELEAEVARLIQRAESAERTLRSVHLRRVIEVAEKHGWNGVENSKVLWTFLDDRLTGLENESERRRGVIESQARSLAEWRRMADEDAGRLARYSTALFQIAHGSVDPEVPALGTADQAPILLERLKALRGRAQRELEWTVLSGAPGRAAWRGAATRPPEADGASTASQGAKAPYPGGKAERP